MAKKTTIFQNLNRAIGALPIQDAPQQQMRSTNVYNLEPIKPRDEVIFTTTDKDEYEAKKLELKQQKFLNMQWYKAGLDSSIKGTAELTNVQMMYRDAQLMDTITPEIGAALDIVAEESCLIGSSGKMLIIRSKSERIAAILEDLFYNRLDLHIILPMICRNLCKYGNEFMLLNVKKGAGVVGWMELPIFEMTRNENGVSNRNGFATELNDKELKNTTFTWLGKNAMETFKFFQVAHFRLITDSTFLPYGTSWLHKARRAWRMLSMMEDMMLIYRLERSIERRIFKIYTGDIDPDDVQAYVQQVANQFKRTPIIDPQTGQVDLRKNFLSVDTDYFIPFRREDASSKIETLNAATNPTSMDDIEYMREKMLAGLRIPKTFLNFQDSQGKGQNLAFIDVRFSRMINRIQQALLMELNKIAIIHLHLMGFEDEVANFTLTMHNPSSQVQVQELDMLGKKVQMVQQLLGDPGNGIQIYSYHRALKEIMHMSEEEIAENLNEIRLEKALATELENTSQIIKKTGVFNPTDRIYGDPNAKYNLGEGGNEEKGGPSGGGMPPMGGMGGGPLGGEELGGGPDMGGLEGLEAPAGGEEGGAEEGGEIPGTPETMDMSQAAGADNGQPQPLQEDTSFFLKYLNKIQETDKMDIDLGRVKTINDNFLINEELDNMSKELGLFLEKSKDNEDNTTILSD